VNFNGQVALIEHFDKLVGRRLEVSSRLTPEQHAYLKGHLKPSTDLVQHGINGDFLFARLCVTSVSYQNTPPFHGCINLHSADTWQGSMVTPNSVAVRVLED
jgi:hypothetical protein